MSSLVSSPSAAQAAATRRSLGPGQNLIRSENGATRSRDDLKKQPKCDRECSGKRPFHSRGTRVRARGVYMKGWLKTTPGSGSPIVTIMQPAESLLRQDATRGFGMSPAVRRFLRQAEMRAILIVVADVFREQAPEMAFIEGNDVIQQVTPAAFHPTLRYTILPRASQRSAHTLDFHRSDGRENLCPILGITIKEHEPVGPTQMEMLLATAARSTGSSDAS